MFRHFLGPRRTVGLALAALASAAQADASHSFEFDLSAPVAISSVVPYGGADVLQGARALAFFSDGHSAEAVFTTFSVGGQQGALAQAGEFFISASSDNGADGKPDEWQVGNLDTSRTLVGFALDGRNGGLGQAAFDINFGPTLNDTGTLGSNAGNSLLMDFALRTFIKGAITVRYSQPLALGGAPAVGDLFARVDVALAYSNVGLNGGLPPNTSLSSQKFGSDLDAVAYVATSPVPEPATAWLLLAGAAGLGLRARRRA